jgi:hypothetical protein
MDHDQTHNSNHQPTAPAAGDHALAGKILERIKEERVVPRPRWEYALANLMFWTLWVCCTLAGAAAVAAATFVFANAGWEFRNVAYPDTWNFLLDAMPLLWISALIVLMLAAYENLRQTSLGYRYPMIAVVGLSVIGSIILGGALYTVGVGERVEEQVGGMIPMHRPIIARERVVWINPNRGLLAGEVHDIDPQQNMFMLRTFDGKDWTVSLEDASPRSRMTILQSSIVRVIGLPIMSATTSLFRACFIFPWNIRGSFPASAPTRTREQPVMIFTSQASDDQALDDTDCEKLKPYQTLQNMQNRMGTTTQK